MLGISAGMETEGQLCCQLEAALVVFLGSGVCLAGFSGDDISRCVPFCGRHAQGARHLGRYGPEGQYVAVRRFWQWHVHDSFAGYDAPRGVFPLSDFSSSTTLAGTRLVLLVTNSLFFL